MQSDVKLATFFLEHAKKHKKRFLAAFAIMPVCAALSVAGPALVKKAIDEGIPRGDWNWIFWISMIYLAVVVMNFLLTTLQMLLMQTAGAKTLQDLRAALLRHISRLPRGIFDKRPVGVYVSRTTSDVEAIGETIATGLTNLITDILTILAIFGVIFFQNFHLGLMTLILLPLIIFIVDFFRKKLRFHNENIRTIHGKLTAQYNESISMLFEVNNFHLEKNFRKEFAEQNRLYMKESVMAISYDALIYSVLEGLSFLVIGFVFLMISRSWVLTHDITIGQLIMYLQLLEVLFSPIKQMGQRFATIQSAFAALEKINRIVSLETLKDEGTKSIQSKDITFKDVSFSYQSGVKVLNNVTFKIPFGQSIAIVGPTGAGKSTIARLLTRQYEPDSGTILLGDLPLPQIQREILRKKVAIVPQDPLLFHETVKFNIAMGRPGITQEQIEAASKQVLADTFIQNLPEKYETRLLEGGGSQISAGQKQLLSLASVLVSGAEILLFDEATANIDTATELLIQKALENVMEHKTVIIIAHRLSTIRHVDHIFVIKNGRIEEQGNHAVLIAQKGLYSKMYEMQNIPSVE